MGLYGPKSRYIGKSFLRSQSKIHEANKNVALLYDKTTQKIEYSKK